MRVNWDEGMPSHDIRIFAGWAKPDYTVSFEANASYLESVSCRSEVSVEECVEEKLMLEETDKHLQNLPVREYAVITCLYINEMSVKETAKELRIKHNTVSTHKKNATALIRKKMEDK